MTVGSTLNTGGLPLGKIGKKKSGWVGPPVPLADDKDQANDQDKNRFSITSEDQSVLSIQSRNAKLVFSPLATHLPDQVVNVDHTKCFPHMNYFQAGVLFLDISGFTALCEKFSMASKNGTDKLTKTLNGYMGNLAQEIINFDGDIMKYAGDAILTLWPVNSILEIQPTLWHMYNCCMSIQKKFGKWETDVGVILKVKIGVSFGDVAVCYVGSDTYRHYVTNGKAVENVNLAEKFCTSGDVVFSPSAWTHVNNLNIPHTLCDDGEHVYVHELHEYDDEEPREVSEYFPNKTILRNQEKDFSEETRDDPGEPSTGSKPDLLPPIGMSTQDMTEKWKAPKKRRRSMVPERDGKSAHRLRKTVCGKIEESVGDALRLFITLPVLQKLDHNQPLEYLSEMRQVSILFINITMDPVIKSSKWQQCKLLQSTFSVIYPAANAFHGCMNKIFMFDKGITFLVLFGLPGYKQENDCMHALQCAHRIKEQLDNVPGIDCASIGVTTGSSFVGVVGHDHRHEYTVIGRKVNMAARLMMHYPDCITCDHNTFYHSKLPKGDFIVLEAKQMKGLVEIGTIRQYCEGFNGTTDEDFTESMKIPEFFFPIIGRDAELNEFKNILASVRSCKDSHKQLQLLVYKGEAGIGRTRLLGAIMTTATELKVKVISTVLTMHDRNTPYFTVKSMLMGLIGLSFLQTHQEREQIIRSHFKDPFLLTHLCLLNNILGVKFAVDDKHKHMDVNAWTKTLHEVFSKIAEEMCLKYGFVIFAVDDSHFMDEESWDFIVDLSRNMRALVVITIKSGVGKTKWCPAAKQLMSDERLSTTIEVQALGKEYLAPLACQFLKVVQIPKAVERLLKEKSHGVPWWCEQIVWQLQRENSISVVKDTSCETINEQSLVAPNNKFFIPKGANIHLPDVSSILEGMGISSTGAVLPKSICITTQKFDIHNVAIPDSIKGIILARLDSMDTTDQMVVKCASILGIAFTQILLCSVLPKVSPRKLGGSIRRLMKQNIFVCDQKRQQLGVINVKSEDSSNGTHCTCDQSMPDNAPDTGMACQWLRFESATVQETAYEMFVENTRQYLHRSAALYFENQAHRCTACGGGHFLSGAYHEQRAVSSNTNLKTEVPGNKRMSSFLRSRHLPRNNRIGSVDLSTSSRESAKIGSLDIRNCQCPMILRSVYPQLVRHWRAVTDIEKTFYYLLEAAAAAIAVADSLQALAYLKEAEMILELVLEHKNPFTADIDRKMKSDVFSRWDKARLQSLLGQAQYFLGHLETSMPHFLSALKYMYNSQPQTKLRVGLRLYQERRIQWLHEHFPKKYLGKVKETRGKWMIEQAHCLSHIFQVNLANNDKRAAFLTVMQLVNCSEKVFYCSHEVVVAYNSMLEYTKMVNSKSLFKKYERKARQRCEDVMQGTPNLQDVLMVIHAYITILMIRISLGPLNEAVGAGMRAEYLSSMLHDRDNCFLLLPKLIYALLATNRLHDAIDRVNRLFDMENAAGDLVAKAWFHWSCMVMVLETGIEVVHPNVCSKFAKQNATDTLTPEPLVALASSLAVWYARTGDIPRASHWLSIYKEKQPELMANCHDAANSLLNSLEVRLIMLARAIAWGLDENIKEYEEEINNTFKAAKDLYPGCKPRLLLLQAYFAAIRGHHFLSNRHLSASISSAKELKMCHLASWAEACQKAWGNANEPAIAWSQLATNGFPNVKTTNKDDLDITFYILPLPAWLNTTK